MTLDSLRRLLLSKPGAGLLATRVARENRAAVLLTCHGEAETGDHPFGPEPHVFKVGGYSLRRVARENRPAVLLALSGFGW